MHLFRVVKFVTMKGQGSQIIRNRVIVPPNFIIVQKLSDVALHLNRQNI